MEFPRVYLTYNADITELLLKMILYHQLGRIVAHNEKIEFPLLLEEYRVLFLQTLKVKNNVNNTYNVLLHIMSCFKTFLTADEKQQLLQTMQDFKDKIIPLIAVVKVMETYINKFEVSYLQRQKFINPYPENLSLCSDIKAHK